MLKALIKLNLIINLRERQRIKIEYKFNWF